MANRKYIAENHMSIVEFLKVIVLGIVEGFAEWLPIALPGIWF